MFGMGMGEILLILAIALIVFGPKKLPDLAKSLGKAYSEFRKATQDFKESIDFDSDPRSVRAPFDQMHEPPVASSEPSEAASPTGSEQASEEKAEPKTTAPPKAEADIAPADSEETETPTAETESAPVDAKRTEPQTTEAGSKDKPAAVKPTTDSE